MLQSNLYDLFRMGTLFSRTVLKGAPGDQALLMRLDIRTNFYPDGAGNVQQEGVYVDVILQEDNGFNRPCKLQANRERGTFVAVYDKFPDGDKGKFVMVSSHDSTWQQSLESHLYVLIWGMQEKVINRLGGKQKIKGVEVELRPMDVDLRIHLHALQVVEITERVNNERLTSRIEDYRVVTSDIRL